MSGGFNGDRCVIDRAVGDFDDVGHHGLIAFEDAPNVAGIGTFVLDKI